MLTLNQIKYKLIAFFENHAQIKDVKYEDDFDFSAERNLVYPICNIEYLSSTVSGKETSHSFKIVLGDLYDVNIKGQSDEIQSDMLLIAEDFFSWAQDFEGFNFQKSVTIQKFVDDKSDRTSGIVFRVSLTVIRTQNTCQIPSKDSSSNYFTDGEDVVLINGQAVLINE